MGGSNIALTGVGVAFLFTGLSFAITVGVMLRLKIKKCGGRFRHVAVMCRMVNCCCRDDKALVLDCTCVWSSISTIRCSIMAGSAGLLPSKW